jgi:hypothetical protein
VTDHFPSKVSPTPNTAKWSVEYKSTYKVLTSAHGHSTVATPSIFALYQCGTTAPTATDVPGLTRAIAVPVKKVSFGTPTLLTFIEMLGERDSIVASATYMTGDNKISSACLQKRHAEGTLADCYDENAAWPTPGRDDAALQTAGVEAVFTDAWTDAYNGVIVDRENESIVGTLEDAQSYLKFISLFYNKEDVAERIAGDMWSRYTCAQGKVAKGIVPSEAKPRILFAHHDAGTGYTSTGWQVYTCPHYYCQYVSDAGGEMVIPTEAGTIDNAWGDNYYSDAQMEVLLATTDAWIHTDDWEAAKAAKASVATAATTNNVRVYDIYAEGRMWFEERQAMPDVLLQDIAKALRPAALDAHPFTMIRDVVATPTLGAYPDPASCTNPSAALEDPGTSCAAINEETTAGGSTTVIKESSDDGGAALTIVCLVAVFFAFGMGFCYVKQESTTRRYMDLLENRGTEIPTKKNLSGATV